MMDGPSTATDEASGQNVKAHPGWIGLVCISVFLHINNIYFFAFMSTAENLFAPGTREKKP